MKMLAGECNLIALPNRSSNETEALTIFPKVSRERRRIASIHTYVLMLIIKIDF